MPIRGVENRTSIRNGLRTQIHSVVTRVRTVIGNIDAKLFGIKMDDKQRVQDAISSCIIPAFKAGTFLRDTKGRENNLSVGVAFSVYPIYRRSILGDWRLNPASFSIRVGAVSAMNYLSMTPEGLDPIYNGYIGVYHVKKGSIPEPLRRDQIAGLKRDDVELIFRWQLNTGVTSSKWGNMLPY